MYVYCTVRRSFALTTLLHISKALQQYPFICWFYPYLPCPLFYSSYSLSTIFDTVHIFSIQLYPLLEGWGFAFGWGRRVIKNRDSLYKNPRPFKKIYTKIYNLLKSMFTIIQKFTLIHRSKSTQ